MIESKDELYLKRCLDLAIRGKGRVSPNPMVGACIVESGEVIGEGFHRGFGMDHAEVEAINNVKETNRHRIPNSTLYVNLEPCNHHGKTPPCSLRIVKEQIPKIVVGCLDPSDAMQGKDIETLVKAGVEVLFSEQPEHYLEFNRYFVVNKKLQRPYVILKVAKSRDGFIGRLGERIWLSNELSSRLSHQWRAECDAILVGSTTVINDDPQLTTRLVPGNDPIRIVIDPNGKIPPNARVFEDPSKVIYVTNSMRSGIPDVKQDVYVESPIEPEIILEQLLLDDIGVLLVEGGAHTLTHFIQSGCWDEARIIETPAVLNSGVKAPLINESIYDTYMLENDRHITLFRNDSVTYWHAKG